jgi:predicted nucleic acid binding AN1-type Zn finger protein
MCNSENNSINNNNNINPESKNNNRCNFHDCNKKLKITDMSCKCGKIFCKIHKFPEDHKCEFNYNSEEIKRKTIESLECKSSKIQKF